MAVVDQIDALKDFALGLAPQDLGRLSLEELVERWRASRIEDEEAIRQSLEDYDRGDRGQPVEDFLKEFRASHTLGEAQ